MLKWLSNQNHINEFKPILLTKFHFGRPQLLIVRGTLGTSEESSNVQYIIMYGV